MAERGNNILKAELAEQAERSNDEFISLVEVINSTPFQQDMLDHKEGTLNLFEEYFGNLEEDSATLRFKIMQIKQELEEYRHGVKKMQEIYTTIETAIELFQDNCKELTVKLQLQQDIKEVIAMLDEMRACVSFIKIINNNYKTFADSTAPDFPSNNNKLKIDSQSTEKNHVNAGQYCSPLAGYETELNPIIHERDQESRSPTRKLIQDQVQLELKLNYFEDTAASSIDLMNESINSSFINQSLTNDELKEIPSETLLEIIKLMRQEKHCSATKVETLTNENNRLSDEIEFLKKQLSVSLPLFHSVSSANMNQAKTLNAVCAKQEQFVREIENLKHDIETIKVEQHFSSSQYNFDATENTNKQLKKEVIDMKSKILKMEDKMKGIRQELESKDRQLNDLKSKEVLYRKFAKKFKDSYFYLTKTLDKYSPQNKQSRKEERLNRM